MPSNVITGNAQIEANKRRGWFIGEFITPAEDPRSTAALEVKWGVHAAGGQRSEWAEPSETTTLSILISGCFRLQFPDGEIVLDNQGDYALWLPGIAHTWEAEKASVVLTIRWLSMSRV
jgi:quercetin dioxygenase-like cupin family protein